LNLPLSLLVPGILFVNHKQLAFAPDDLTIGAALLYGCFNFHFIYLYLNTILPFVKSYGDISNRTLSPGRIRM